MKLASLISTLALLASSHVYAQGIRIGTPAYGGTGCPNGTASVTVSPAEDAISVLFDQFVTEAGGTTGRRFDRKSCNLTIPVRVPGGYSVAIFAVDYRGFNAVPSGGYNKLTAEYFWAGMRGPTMTRQFNGPTASDYTATDNLLASTLVWAPCGQSVNLRINAGLMSMANSAMQQTLGTVDSVDLTSGLIYHIKWQRCH